MQIQVLRLRAFAFIACLALLTFSGWANADPPARVARLGYLAGTVSFSPAGENDWLQAMINRPLANGDRLWTDAGARAEVQVGGAMVRMNAGTGLTVLNLDDRSAQLQLMQGTLNVRVYRLDPSQVFEVGTPNLAFTLRHPGEYRIYVDPDGNATTIIVRKGQGEVSGEGATYVVDSRQSYRFSGNDLREYQYVDAPLLDEFDRWTSNRDRRYDNSGSARYVSRDVIGYQDLDANGTWHADATYGNVWIPNQVAVGWVPYRDGHWAWINPWGWTWVDDAPWGFAVSHYGRWTHLRGRWGWVPGPMRVRAYYAPALVVFVGGDNFQLTLSSGNVGGVAWFPLGPREVYRPAYPVSRGYFENINRSNTVINNVVINNYYNHSSVTNVVYANRRVRGAVTAVPTTAFVQSQPVSVAAVRVPRDMIVRAPVGVVPAAAPTENSAHGSAVPTDRPPARVFARSGLARSAAPAASGGLSTPREPVPVAPGGPPARIMPSMQGTSPPQQRARSDQRSNEAQRGQPVVPRLLPLALPQRAIEPRTVQPQAVPIARRPAHTTQREDAAGVKPFQSRAPEIPPKALPPPPHPRAALQPAPTAEPTVKKHQPAAIKPVDMAKDHEEHKRADENRRPKG